MLLKTLARGTESVEHIIIASHRCKSFPHKTVPHAKIRKQMSLEHKEWSRLFSVKAN